MVVEVNGNKTTKTIKNLPHTEEYYITIEAQQNNKTKPKGSSYPLTIRKKLASFINVRTLPKTPELVVLKTTYHEIGSF